MKVKVFNSQTLIETKELDLAVATRINGECTVGRSPNSGLILDSPDVSRLHGKLFFQNGNYYFCDLGSSNGSMVNSKFAGTNQSYILKPGDVIRIGEFVLILEAIRKVPDEELPETVIGGNDATVISWWRSSAKFDTPEVANQAPDEVSEIPEVMAQAPEAIMHSPEEVSEAPELVTDESELGTGVPEEVGEASEITSFQEVTIIQDVTIIQVPESAEISEVMAQTPEAVSEISEITYVQAPEVFESAEVFDAMTQAPEAVNEVAEPATQAPEEVSEASDTIAQAPAAVSEASGKEEVPEVVSQVPSEHSEVSEVTSIQDLTSIQIPESAEVVDVITQAPEESEAAAVSEVMAQTQSPVSEVTEIISEKYIALMAHDSKKSDLAHFVAQHKEFFSKCRTIATPPISETLYQQSGVAISQQTPSVPVGGYQTIASLVGSGDILAVILLRDFLVAQSGQANEEALLRLCNINQVLFATNVSTAEAIVHYITNMVTSL